MKTKEEVIKEAYGEHWDRVKDYVDDNGWVYGSFQDEVQLNLTEWEGYEVIRPKSLAGIENNNGWIKIESEEDLPKKNGTYFTKTRHDDIVRVEIIAPEGLEEIALQWYVNHFTHYQPIVKPKPPIY